MNHKLSSKSAWVFDLDGTLTNPVHDFAHMRKELGMAADADILQTLTAMQGNTKKQLTLKLDALEAFYASKASPAIGVQKLIRFLAAQGYQLGIFTRNTKDMAILSLEAIGVADCFDHQAIIGRDDAPHKPNPQGLFSLLANWKIAVEDAVMIGDFRFDLEVGRAAGTTTVHVSTEQSRWPELTDYYFPTLAELHQELTPSKQASLI